MENQSAANSTPSGTPLGSNQQGQHPPNTAAEETTSQRTGVEPSNTKTGGVTPNRTTNRDTIPLDNVLQSMWQTIPLPNRELAATPANTATARDLGTKETPPNADVGIEGTEGRSHPPTKLFLLRQAKKAMKLKPTRYFRP
ncbi:hypothetical protein PCANC_15479 [Puccinia coronata f. sp. avenae]|uniref:Uncharacterized protein n=1 Tax=Puccinia coronata f. sp. avenae TaxID=200324 RepID=A0A2N5VFC1_9BASI|nr:hypothetical protein PCANC_15479 [Puccinia coronata f. sp. avenae]